MWDRKHNSGSVSCARLVKGLWDSLTEGFLHVITLLA